jgi:hypothetical protein
MYLSFLFFSAAVLLEYRWKTFRNPYEGIPKRFY